MRAGLSLDEEIHERLRRSTRGSSPRCASWSRPSRSIRAIGLPTTPERPAPAQGDGLLRQAPRRRSPARPRPWSARLRNARWRSARSTSASTPARPSSPRRPPTCIRPTTRPFAGKAADEANPSDRKKVVILGGGPNRIGQGIEFDYCCCHACLRADAMPATRPSWSTATRRRSRPTTTPPTASISSR